MIEPPPSPPLPLRLARLPVAAAQALRTRRAALHLPEPPGPRSGTLGEGPPLRLLIAGDSSAAGVGTESQAEGLSGRLTAPLAERLTVTWRLEARTGHTTARLLAHLRGLEPAHWDAVVVCLGVNDATRMVPYALWTRQQRALHALLRDRFGARRIYRTGVPPLASFPLLPSPLSDILGARTWRYDSILAGLAAAEADLRHIPFDAPLEASYMAADGYHPGPALYAAWGARIAREVLGDFG